MVFGFCLKICEMGQSSLSFMLKSHLLKVCDLLNIRGDSIGTPTWSILAQGQKCLAQIVKWAHTGQTEIDILDQIVIGIKKSFLMPLPDQAKSMINHVC